MVSSFGNLRVSTKDLQPRHTYRDQASALSQTSKSNAVSSQTPLRKSPPRRSPPRKTTINDSKKTINEAPAS